MMKKTALAAAITAAVAWSGSAFAHELECRKTVNGQRYYEVTEYPDELDYRLEVRNIHPSLPSDVLDLEDELLEELPAGAFSSNTEFVFDPDAPFTLDLNEREVYEATVRVVSFENCMRLAARDGTPDEFIDNVFRVEWDSGEDHCRARVKCVQTPPPPPPPDVECRKHVTIVDQRTGLPIRGDVIPSDTAVYLDYRLAVRNNSETDAEITDLEESLLELLPDSIFVPAAPFAFDPAPPYTLQGGDREVYDFRIRLDANQCTRLDNVDGADDDRITNVFTVTWNGHTSVCRDVVYCTPPPPPPPPDGCNNRTIGFYKTHFGALDACFAAVDAVSDYDAFPGDMDSADDLAALLWTTPGDYENPLDKARFQLARQLLAAICNVEVFGSTPIDEIQDALDALAGTDCTEIRDLAGELDDWNNSCEGEQEPHGFGRADPQYAADRAEEGTNPIEDNSGQVCGGSVTLN